MSELQSAAAAIAHIGELFIGGAWVPPVEGGLIDLVSPDTEQAFASVAEGGPEDIRRAIAAARKAFDNGPWPAMAPIERIRIVRKLGEALERRSADLGQVWSAQIGGLEAMAPLTAMLGNGNITNAVATAEGFAFEHSIPSQSAAAGLIVHEAVGVVAAIAPWNGPYMLMTAKVAPALLAGCTVIMKPSPETPLEAYIIAECAEEIGLPPGVINLVTAHRDAADILVRDPGVDKIAFTGSTAAGRHIASVCGERLARCTLELGGKSAAIVADDYTVQDAARLLAQTITMMSGQVCAMLSRAIVPRSRHDDLADAIVQEMEKIRVGRPHDQAAQMGPLASRRHYDNVIRHIARGQTEGARLAFGGGRPPHLKSGCYLEPTLFANVDNRTSIAQQEVFGPVLCLIPCDDLDDGVRIANESDFGLHGSVLSHDPDLVYRIGRRVRTGSFAQSGMNVDFSLPFGGFKQSGLGREGGREGLMSYLETKTMLFNTAPTLRQ
jgi:acyl-CoA reductase-like NAD-dependent aldehyde dehydrogenase